MWDAVCAGRERLWSSLSADVVPLDGETFHSKVSVCNCSGIVRTVEETRGSPGQGVLGAPHTAGFSEGTWKSFIKEDELPVCEVREAGSPEE